MRGRDGEHYARDHDRHAHSAAGRSTPGRRRTRREIKNPQREAILLAAVTITERLHIEIERLLAIARDNVSRDIRARLRLEIEAVLQAIASALQQYAREAATGLKVVDDHAYQQCFTKIRASLDALQAREDLILDELRSVDAAAVGNIVAFTQSLRRIGERLRSVMCTGSRFPRRRIRRQPNPAASTAR